MLVLMHSFVGLFIPDRSLRSERAVHRILKRIRHLCGLYQPFVVYVILKRAKPTVYILRDLIVLLFTSFTAGIHDLRKIPPGIGVIVCCPIVASFFIFHINTTPEAL